MALSSWLVLLLQLLSCVPAGLACHCQNYPWTSWSTCSATCNSGSQYRTRRFHYDDYYHLFSCGSLCASSERRSCNQQACPINCQLTEFGPWSDCSPCARKQFRTRALLRPSQFNGAACTGDLTEERPCHPSRECLLPAIDCKDNFKCDNGRCINSTLTCNRQNDCGDNSDERDCGEPTIVCPAEKRVPPGSDLVGNGFDGMAEEPRAAVLDNTFMGGTCNLKRVAKRVFYYRIPHNFKNFEIKVGEVEDFSTQRRDVHSEVVTFDKSTEFHGADGPDKSTIFIPLILLPMFYFGSHSQTRESSNKQVLKASQQMDSKFFRVQQIVPVATFELKGPEDLVLSLPFLQYLQALPLEYNYALYREIFQRFGTHYSSSGSLGGHYNLIYQYNRQELISSGQTDEHVSGCLNRQTTFTVILYTQHSSVSRCHNDKMTEKYRGSYIEASEKSISMVRGGRAREAAALAWARQGAAPNHQTYKNWIESVIDNPAIVDIKLLSILDLVRGIPCAVTKRRHLRKALLQYMDEFDVCKCSPCPNNGKPVLSGTECKCQCQPGTYGPNCELTAQDFTSAGRADGSWSCWGPWSDCGSTMKRHRTRQCNNPWPSGGGRPCQGPARSEETCYISIFSGRETCDNDDDFYEGQVDKLPPGVEGCLPPTSPDYSFLRKSKDYYSFGEEEEFECFTGFELEGYQFFNCRPDGTWSEPSGKCVRKVCLPPEVPETMALSPNKGHYRMGESVGLACMEAGKSVLPRGRYTCGAGLTWEPPFPADLVCTDAAPFVPDDRCGPGEHQVGTRCFCIQRESCLNEPQNLCVLNLHINQPVSMSHCSFLAGRCHKDPLFFISEGACSTVDEARVEWAKYRASMATKSSVAMPCALDTCYEWETCSASSRCVCRSTRSCPPDQRLMYCVKLTKNQRIKTMNLCTMAAHKCAKYDFEIINEGVCRTG